MKAPPWFAQILADARAGNREALGKALEACRSYLTHVGYLQIPDDLLAKGGPSDLVQVTFLEAMRALPNFHGTTEREFLAWLCKLLLRNARNFERNYRDVAKRQIDREESLDDLREKRGEAVLAVETDAPDAAVASWEETGRLHRAVEELPERSRLVVKLRGEEARSFGQIGALLGVSADTARKIWSRACEILARRLDSE